MKTVVAAALIALASWPGTAQAINCKKGIPCEGSCISATKVCRISQPSTATTPAPKSTPPASSTNATQQSSDYGDLVPATISCPAGRVPAADVRANAMKK